MFTDYLFIMTSKETDGVEEEVSMSISTLNLLTPLTLIDFESGDETEIMGKTLLAFIEELDKTFNIINLT